MTFRRAVLTVLLVTGITFVLGTGTASASCHAFTVSAQPSSVNEGGAVTITVTRDGAVNPSSVRVRTAAGTATSADFTAMDQSVSFGDGELSKSLSLRTTGDLIVEPDEQLKLHLSNGAGCNGSGFSYGPDATVTIQDDDAPATTTTAPTTTSSSSTSSTSSTTSSSTTSTTAASTSSSSTTEDPDDGADTTEVAASTEGLRETGGGSWMLPIVLGGVAVAAFGGAFAVRHRLVGGEDLDDVDYDPDDEA